MQLANSPTYRSGGRNGSWLLRKSYKALFRTHQEAFSVWPPLALAKSNSRVSANEIGERSFTDSSITSIDDITKEGANGISVLIVREFDHIRSPTAYDIQDP